MQTIAFGVDKQWDPAVEQRELYPVTCDGTWWKIMWEKEYVCVYVCIYIYIYIYDWDWVTLLHSRNWQNTVNQYNGKNKNYEKTKTIKLKNLKYYF